MSIEEKSAWLQALVGLVVPGIYFVAVVGQLQTTPVSEIAYQATMLATIGVVVTLLIVAHVAIAFGSPREADRSHERDKGINRYGEYIGSFILYGGGLLALGLALATFEQLWIANTLFAAFVLAGLLSSAVKIAAYRRGF